MKSQDVIPAARRAVAGAGGPVAAMAVALHQPGDMVPPEVALALASAVPGAPAPMPVAAGTAAALAEQWCGAARDQQDIITFALGEHVTAGVILAGKPCSAHGLAGAVGWLALNPVEREDYRRYGGLEAEVAAAGIVRRLVWRIKSGDRSAVADQAGGDLTRLTAEHVFQGARADFLENIGPVLPQLKASLPQRRWTSAPAVAAWRLCWPRNAKPRG